MKNKKQAVGLGFHICSLWVNLHTQDTQMVFLTQMGLKETSRKKIRHYQNVYLNRPDLIVLDTGQLTHTRRSDGDPDPNGALMDTSGRLYDDFIRLFFFHTHREVPSLPNELPEESDQFRFIRSDCLGNLKGSVGLIMEKVSLDLSSRSFIPLLCFIRSHRPTPFLAPSLTLFPPCSP
jgi:hypothetical protein